MKYYAHFGHKDFILCLGYSGSVIKDYFLHYDEAVSNDFVWSEGGKKIQFLNREIDDWTITFV
jgi:glucose-1-phosphate cytidylyltransferase